MELIGRWILERWPDMPREIGQQMIYHRGGYLAHLSLTTDNWQMPYTTSWRL